MKGLGVETAITPYRSMRAAVNHLFREGRLPLSGPAAMGVLVDTLLDRGAEGDVAEAEAGWRGWRRHSDDDLLARHLAAGYRSTCAGSRRCRGLRPSGIAIVRWRNRLASKDISPGPRRCDLRVLKSDQPQGLTPLRPHDCCHCRGRLGRR